MNPLTPVLAQRLWEAVDDGVGFESAPLRLSGPRVTLPSSFDVSGLAVGAVAGATLAAAQLLAARRGRTTTPAVHVDSRAAASAFSAEGLFTPLGWERAPLWDPIAGNYAAADGWIRLHTNYPSHRSAVATLLDIRDRATVQRQVATLAAVELERAVVEAGGAAAAMRTRAEWLASPAGSATGGAPAVTTRWRAATQGGPPTRWVGRVKRPFGGLRVLDLTRVIAGPVCTTYLAGYGADVLRIDPPGFEEVASLLPETTRGKRTTALDLGTAEGRLRFEELVGDADVLVCGLRADALGRHGYDDAQLRALNPDLLVARINAYGWDGPWRQRRGFDSLVQLSCGMAARGRRPGSPPTALPVQALDHATGWLMGAAIARALTQQLTERRVGSIRASLIGTANLLWELPQPPGHVTAPVLDDVPLVDRITRWGPAKGVGAAAQIAGVEPQWTHPAGPLGGDEPHWERGAGDDEPS